MDVVSRYRMTNFYLPKHRSPNIQIQRRRYIVFQVSQKIELCLDIQPSTYALTSKYKVYIELLRNLTDKSAAVKGCLCIFGCRLVISDDCGDIDTTIIRFYSMQSSSGVVLEMSSLFWIPIFISNYPNDWGPNVYVIYYPKFQSGQKEFLQKVNSYYKFFYSL